ncbi:MAG: DUF1343 domain-containing protein [Leptospiraceae bacterium]|nr:DUF1343 domain-containing protein [Leptospiraceae bacterium]
MEAVDHFLATYDLEIKKARPNSWALLCNQSSWSFLRRQYLFQILASHNTLARVFLPEHGLFAELQDQVGLDETSSYQFLADGVEFISLYGTQESSLLVPAEKITDLDLLIVDIQDVGSRYYTFATTMAYVFEVIRDTHSNIRIVVIDRPNPAGLQVEGSVLQPEYASFVGYPGLPHRHGLTIGELALFFKDQIGLTNPVEVVYDDRLSADYWFTRYTNEFQSGSLPGQYNSISIWPSPNMAHPVTPRIYSGQCLLEGTNLSEGRGTTRPFEIFGAPWLRSFAIDSELIVPGAQLRPLRFIPVYHKHANQVCEGFQIHLDDANQYHSLAHTLRMLRLWKARYTEFEWRDAEYEFRSDRPAIELLAGDRLLLDFLEERESLQALNEYLSECEHSWRLAASYWYLHKR